MAIVRKTRPVRSWGARKRRWTHVKATAPAPSSRGPGTGIFAVVLSSLMQKWPHLLPRVKVLDLSDVGPAAPCENRAWPPATFVLRPPDFSGLGARDSSLRVLRVARASSWSDEFVAAVLVRDRAGDHSRMCSSRLHTLSMSGTAVTMVAVECAWSAGVMEIDVSCVLGGGWVLAPVPYLAIA